MTVSVSHLQVMIGLPKELWDCITDHLNDIEAWRLRNVNHVLRQVAFDRQFNAVCLRVGHLAKLDHLQALSFLGSVPLPSISLL